MAVRLLASRIGSALLKKTLFFPFFDIHFCLRPN
jgi:hypothetical protein